MAADGLLSGVRVLDLTRILAGPYCTMVLGDLGADVLKVEHPERGDDTRHWGPPFAEGGESAYFLAINRNKRSLALDLKTDRGRSILVDLIRQSDVLIENFRAGTMARWGLDYETLQEVHEGLIYCTITGFGQTGPYRDRPGYDFFAQAIGGLMSITGPPDGEPYRVGVAVVDITAGLFAANAILASLYARDRTGSGQYIDISLLDAQVAWLANVGSNYLVTGEVPKRYGNAHPNVVPYQVFEACDGYFAFGIGNDGQWRTFCEAVAHPEWGQDERFCTNAARVEHRDVLIPLLAEVFMQRDVASWLDLLEDAGIPAAPINTLDGVFRDPQVQARNMRIEVSHPTAGTVSVVGSPLKLAVSPPRVRYPPPLLGQHTVEVLQQLLDYDEATIQALRNDSII